MNYTTYRPNMDDLIGLYCNCTKENVKLISNKYNFWELGDLDNYIPYNDYIVIYQSGNTIECMMLKKDPSKEPIPPKHNIKDFKFISDEDLKLLIDGPSMKIELTLEIEIPYIAPLGDIMDTIFRERIIHCEYKNKVLRSNIIK